MKNYEEITSCVACGSTELVPVLNLGNQPLANSYTKSQDEVLEEFPLAVNRCSHCHHVQLSVAVNPDLMFKDYLYVSGTSKTMHTYFDWFSKYCTEYHNLLFKSDNYALDVLDIGCNDGTLLDKFNDLDCDTQGIDPAENLHIESSKRHDIICGYFNEENLTKVIVPDIITALNVFAHNNDPIAFMNNAKKIMAYKTLFFIQTSQANLIPNNEYDSIYHEHISFYNIKSMHELCKRSGLNLIDVVKTPLHGTSYLFVVSKDINRDANIENLIAIEDSIGLYKDSTYVDYAIKCINVTEKLKATVSHYRDLGYKVIGYGAAAKGNTVLNFSKIELDYIIDDNPLKWFHFAPGSKVKIVSKEILDLYSDDDKILYIPLAWNFFKEISSNIRSKRNNINDKFLLFFPEVKVF